jgi:hypothetical protein
LEKVESEEVKAEKKRAKEAKEAKKNEASGGVQNAIEEANLLAKQLKEEAKRVKVEATGDCCLLPLSIGYLPCCSWSVVYCLLAVVYCLLDIGYWLLAIGYWHV